MTIKSFRGLMKPDTIDQISLHTNTGSTGYRIKKLDIIQETPGVGDVELVIKVYTIPQTTATTTIDFSDSTLLAVAMFRQDPNNNSTADKIIIFDNVTFNQDIFVTCADAMGATVAGNYHIELEQVKLNLEENTVATLKDIRNIASQ